MSIMVLIKLHHISGNLQAICVSRAANMPALHTCTEFSPLADLEAVYRKEMTAKVEL